MDKINLFNKESFAELLDKAKGDRSINRYAEETEVSAAHISRFLREMIDAPPTPETISKLSSKAYNDVSYRDLMVAAGHISIVQEEGTTYNQEDSVIANMLVREDNSIIERSSPNERRAQIMNLEKKLFQIILSYLYEVPFEWNMRKPDSRTRRPDMIIDIDNEGYTKWLIEFRVSLEPSRMFGMSIQPIYGRLATTELTATDKVSIVVNDEIAFDSLVKRPPISLRANVYVMLVDIEQGKVVKEEQLSSYDHPM